ncbi:MAG TPA: hypothetical protein DIC22_11620 [Chitinophagaceae bacterium]|nr:hypothetical protein [Chitinophagaceae bacterium]
MFLHTTRNTNKRAPEFLRFIFIFILTGFSFAVLAQKTDKICLRNGDTLTGEILSMKLAMLTYKMDGPGTIDIKWEYVTCIRSNKVFEFTLRKGNLVVCTLDTLFLKYQVTNLDDIVEIIPIKDRFLTRLVGDVNLGFNYTKSNSILQSNFTSNITYKVPKVEIGLKLNSVLTNYGEDTSFSKKQDIFGSITRNLSKKFYVGGSLGWQENTELGLASRYLLSGLAGLESLTDNHNRLLFAGGLSYNQEQSVETSQFKGNLDALLEARYMRFYYSFPKLSIDADYLVFPGITDWGRVRMQFDLNVSVEIFRDFLIGLVSYYSYDNRPPEGSFSNSDYGIQFTVGYKFGK